MELNVSYDAVIAVSSCNIRKHVIRVLRCLLRSQYVWSEHKTSARQRVI
jgi:hypothetical protein